MDICFNALSISRMQSIHYQNSTTALALLFQMWYLLVTLDVSLMIEYEISRAVAVIISASRSWRLMRSKKRVSRGCPMERASVVSALRMPPLTDYNSHSFSLISARIALSSSAHPWMSCLFSSSISFWSLEQLGHFPYGSCSGQALYHLYQWQVFSLIVFLSFSTSLGGTFFQAY